MARALLYLRVTTLVNMVVDRIRRMRQPKYLVGFGVAVMYFYFVLLRRTGALGPAASVAAGDRATAGLVAAAFICTGASILALVRIAWAWISPDERPGLRFSEAEIAFLFPAPVARRTLIHFRLLSAQLTILFTSVLIAVFFNRAGFLGGNRTIHAVGWWVILSTFDLHLNGTKLALSRLRETSRHFVLWRVCVVAGIVLYVGAVAWAAAGIVDATVSQPFASRGPAELVTRLMASPAFRWLILPFRIVLGPYFSTGYGEFAKSIVPALLLLALNYHWVSSSEARFEEGSIALAEKRAAARAALQQGEAPKVGAFRPKARPGPFPLSPQGLPEVAFLWKNLLSMRSALLGRRALVIVVVLLVWMASSLGPLLAGQARSGGADVYGPVIVGFCGMAAAYTILLGPQIARQDLRSDLSNADMLKTYPLEGWRLVLGELLAPTALLTLILWFTIAAAAAAIDPVGKVEWLTRGVRLTAALGLGAAAPLLCLIQLLVPNSIMVLLPGWYQASRSRTAGIEMFGQRLIFGVVQLFFALLVILPSAGWAALVIFCSQHALGAAPAIALGAAAVLFILATEAAVGLWWLGQRFERFDLSTESR
jgi:hypothetical protein